MTQRVSAAKLVARLFVAWERPGPPPTAAVTCLCALRVWQLCATTTKAPPSAGAPGQPMTPPPPPHSAGAPGTAAAAADGRRIACRRRGRAPKFAPLPSGLPGAARGGPLAPRPRLAHPHCPPAPRAAGAGCRRHRLPPPAAAAAGCCRRGLRLLLAAYLPLVAAGGCLPRRLPPPGNAAAAGCRHRRLPAPRLPPQLAARSLLVAASFCPPPPPAARSSPLLSRAAGAVDSLPAGLSALVQLDPGLANPCRCRLALSPRRRWLATTSPPPPGHALPLPLASRAFMAAGCPRPPSPPAAARWTRPRCGHRAAISPLPPLAAGHVFTAAARAPPSLSRRSRLTLSFRPPPPGHRPLQPAAAPLLPSSHCRQLAAPPPLLDCAPPPPHLCILAAPPRPPAGVGWPLPTPTSHAILPPGGAPVSYQRRLSPPSLSRWPLVAWFLASRQGPEAAGRACPPPTGEGWPRMSHSCRGLLAASREVVLGGEGECTDGGASRQVGRQAHQDARNGT